ncbi:hypothetical protein [Terrabacter aerolatus]|uniref:hypothetical protein n=1 Tax=Terrabacter aerolatus TaxID=422442 RepID=UPI0011BF1FC8|nr:hypothetical protein [Terrabacter aerolatus]
MPDAVLHRLVDGLVSADPAVRDDGAHAALARLLREGGVGVDDRSWLACGPCARCTSPSVRTCSGTTTPSPCATPVRSGARSPGSSAR